MKTDLPKFLLNLVCAIVFPTQNLEAKCLQIFYDHVESDYRMSRLGRLHALHLDNLVGHFQNIQTYVIPMKTYKSGDLERCESSIYLGTYYGGPIPDAFPKDFVASKQRVVWIGYNIWQLSADELKSLWGVSFKGLSKLEMGRRDAQGRPGFFKYYSYKQETFEKYGEWDRKDLTRFNAAWEIPLFEMQDSQAQSNVISWAKHNTLDQEVTPWVLSRGTKWYVGDSPFSFVTERDRYLIFADMLFDILDEKPRWPESAKKPALFRVEDVHPKVPMWQLYRMIDVLKKHDVPFSMTMVPIFSDPFGIVEQELSERFVPVTRDWIFRDFIELARSSRTTFIYHGVTHQSGHYRNPFSGTTGDDFEFWDRVKNRPIENDNVPFILNRLEDGLKLFDLVGVRPVAWTSPHYQASPLAYSMFGQLFSWNVGRVIYFPYTKSQGERLTESFNMTTAGHSAINERRAALSDLVVTYDKEQLPSGQFYPYEIYGDNYRQRIIPENVGNIQAYMNEQVFQTHTVDELIEDLRRTRVIRDSWGSFFIHPFCLESTTSEGLGAFPGDVQEIERLIIATRSLGYEFLDLGAWIARNTLPLRPETIEVSP